MRFTAILSCRSASYYYVLNSSDRVYHRPHDVGTEVALLSQPAQGLLQTHLKLVTIRRRGGEVEIAKEAVGPPVEPLVPRDDWPDFEGVGDVVEVEGVPPAVVSSTVV